MDKIEDLDVLFVPVGPSTKIDLARARVAVSSGLDDIIYHIGGVRCYSDNPLISARSGCYGIYSVLREKGVKPKDMTCDLKSRDSLENYLFFLNKYSLNSKLNIGVVTDSLHFKRFYLFNRIAQEEGLVTGDFNLSHIDVNYEDENLKDVVFRNVYGLLAYVKDVQRVRGGLKKAVNNKTTCGVAQSFKDFLWGE